MDEPLQPAPPARSGVSVRALLAWMFGCGFLGAFLCGGITAFVSLQLAASGPPKEDLDIFSAMFEFFGVYLGAALHALFAAMIGALLGAVLGAFLALRRRSLP